MMKKLITTLTAIVIILSGIVPTYAAATKDAELMLKSSVTSAKKGDKFKVDIVLKNPSANKIISVRSWLTYDAKSLKATGIDTKSSLFTLSAPGEDTVASSEGRVKIGRSNISGGVTKTETTVASVNFEVIAATAATSKISFYDYQVSELGHASVNIIDSGFPLNILSKKPAELSITLNPGVIAAPTVTTPPVVTTTTSTPVTTLNTNIGGGTSVITLKRPTNLKVNTGSGYVDLKWDGTTDLYRSGFNIYYGQVSGQYSRRRVIGNLTSYRLSGLTNNQTYYFAVTAYDSNNKESDYSNEVGVIVNQPLSSTHPFATLFQKTVASIPLQPQNGPLVGWFIFSAAGLGGAVVFGRKKGRKIKINK